MRIACAQFQPVLGDLDANRRQVERQTAEAAGVDLLVFPELASSGYAFASREEAMAAAESARDGPFARLLVDLARRHRMFLVAGLCEKDGERLYNTAILAGPDGVRGLYRKAHLFWDEKDIFEPGDTGLPVFDVAARDLVAGDVVAGDLVASDLAAGGPAASRLAASRLGPGRGDWRCRIGILICFDWQFPEAWRVLALKGADVVCHPSNLVLPGLAQRAVPLHAMMNRVFVILANRYGTERHLSFTGESLLISPRGEELSRAPADADAILIAEIDPAAARDKWVTPRNDLIADRRPELYGEIVGQATEPGDSAGPPRAVQGDPEAASRWDLPAPDATPGDPR
jgi:predicted amidohydrolase